MYYVISLVHNFEDGDGCYCDETRCIGVFENLTPKDLREIWETISEKKSLEVVWIEPEEWQNCPAHARIQKKESGADGRLYSIHYGYGYSYGYDILIQKFEGTTEYPCEYTIKSIESVLQPEIEAAKQIQEQKRKQEIEKYNSGRNWTFMDLAY